MDYEKAKKNLNRMIEIYHSDFEGQCDEYRDALEKAIEAIEKAQKYRWHDLRKDPKDLPETIGMYGMELGGYHIIYPKSYMEGGLNSVEVADFTDGEWTFGWGINDEVIAWRDIETFKEDE